MLPGSGTRRSLASSVVSSRKQGSERVRLQVGYYQTTMVGRSAFHVIVLLLIMGLFSSSSGSSYRYVDQSILVESGKASRNGGHHALPNINEDDYTEGYEEDLAPGGDYVKLLLLPKPFSPNFRENWEIYRTEYWEKENERRSVLRQKIKERDRKIAKEQGGWLWWTGYRGWNRGKTSDTEKAHHMLHRQEHKRAQSGSVRTGSHSQTISKCDTNCRDGRGKHCRATCSSGSTASSASERRRKRTG